MAFAAQPSGVAEVTAEGTVAHVIDVVRRVRRHGPMVLVGHSFGGLVVTAVGNAVPELVDRMVHVAAQCPVTRAPGEYLSLPEWSTSALLPATAALVVGNPAELGCIRLNWRGADRVTRAALRNAIAAEATDDEFVQLIATSQPDEVFWQADPSWDHKPDKATWGRLPRVFVRTTEDRAMPPAAQDRYITEADALTPDNPFEVYSIHSSHTGFFRHPTEIVEVLEGLV